MTTNRELLLSRLQQRKETREEMREALARATAQAQQLRDGLHQIDGAIAELADLVEEPDEQPPTAREATTRQARRTAARERAKTDGARGTKGNGDESRIMHVVKAETPDSDGQEATQ